MSPELPPPDRNESFLLPPPAVTPPPLPFPDTRGARHLAKRSPICQVEGLADGAIAVAFVDSPARLDMALVDVRSFSAPAERRKALERVQQQACLLLPKVLMDDLTSERCSTCSLAPAAAPAGVDLVLHDTLVGGIADDCLWIDPACLPTDALRPADAWQDRQPTRRQASMVVDAPEY